MGAFGGHPEQLNTIKKAKEHKSASSIITFSSNEEDYYSDEEEKNVERSPSEADGIGNINEGLKCQEWDDSKENVHQKADLKMCADSERTLVAQVKLDVKAENETNQVIHSSNHLNINIYI